MANKEIVDLTAATTPLDGTELALITQGGNSRKVSALDLARAAFVSGTAISNSDVSTGALTLPADGNTFVSTITSTVTSIVTVAVDVVVRMVHSSAHTFTHHATDLICLGGVSAVVAAGDITEWQEYATGDWRMVAWHKASGNPVAGGMIKHQTITLNNQATADFTGIPSAATAAYFHLDRVRPASDANLYMRFSEDGSTWLATAYDYTQIRNGSATDAGGAAQTQVVLTSTVGNEASEYCSGEVTLYNPGANAPTQAIYSTGGKTSAGALFSASGYAQRNANGPTVGVRFLFQTGNLFTGTITCWYTL